MTTLATSADLQVFWTAFDPLDLASGSIDVLGFQRGYIALADKILPGFTTVTTSPRYLSMLCAAIGVAQEKYPDSAVAPVKLRQQRLAAVKSFERAWALACELASTETRIGRQAVDGLRGIQSVRRRLSALSGREKYVRTGSFNLLANQVRYGGIGAYSAMLDDCHLATMRSLSLRPLGMALAEAFPMPSDPMPAHDEDKRLSLHGLQEWGGQCHLGSFGKREAKTLTAALRGGEEGGWEDDVRWTMLRFISGVSQDTDREPELLGRLLSAIENGTMNSLKVPTSCGQQIHAALVVIQPFERFYQACQFLFDAIRAEATDEAATSLETLSKKPAVLAGHEAAQSSANQVSTALHRAREIHAKTKDDITSVFIDAELSNLLTSAESCGTALEMLSLMLDRHRDVQQGKIDKGERKSPWVQRVPSGDKVRLTAQRYQLPVSERWADWNDVPWHPYRTSGARRFIRQCDIR